MRQRTPPSGTSRRSLPCERKRKENPRGGRAAVLCCGLLILLLASAACTSHQVEVKPVEVKPIHITIDINVRVDRALDDYFGDLDEIQSEQ